MKKLLLSLAAMILLSINIYADNKTNLKLDIVNPDTTEYVLEYNSKI
ncbi:hypothetical protein MHTCC0001_01560 [Flavobacteriaceae bacterium MHTCC 0001]